MGGNKKVVKFKKRRSINIGVIVFIIMFVYIAINVYIYFTKDQLSIYEVHAGTTAVDNRITGMILREEKIINTDKAGYVTYYQKEGARIAKKAQVYSINENGQMIDMISSGEADLDLSEKNNDEIRHDLTSFHNNFSDSDFSYVYKFEEEVQSTVLDILTSTMITYEQESSEESGATYSAGSVASTESGIITYYSDNYESISADSVTSDMFQPDKYTKSSLRTTDILAKNSPVYKLVTSDTWNIVLPLTEEQYKKLADKEYVSITILEDDYETKAQLTLSKRGETYYATLTLDEHLLNYLEERYIDVELNFSSETGLKIPLTSIIEKNFYLVPLEYFTYGGDSDEYGLITEKYDENGDVTYPFVKADKYFEDDAYGYVDSDLFEAGSWIHSPETADRYQLTQMNKLTGVYNVNLGYAVFKRIEILSQNEEYCIINDETSNGLSAYDHIALDGTTAVEKAIIY
ncbi:MAG: HlyD family efflux transporter periplasmic adaptor subunit [Mobilitalea sp.]